MDRTNRTIALTSLLAAGCLDPLSEDVAGTSVHVLPAGAAVPGVEDDAELVHQIATHDGLDDRDLEDSGGVVERIDGWSNGAPIRYWSFGPAPGFGASIYQLVDDDGPIDHPYLLDSLPGEPAYSPIRRIQEVPVTAAYGGERLTTMRALSDAIELGLIEEPVPAGTWFDGPVVPPGVVLSVADGVTAAPIEAYGGGFRVSMFVFGGELGVQPLRNGGIPIGQASQLRAPGEIRLGPAPIFQWGPPSEAPGESFNYTPLTTLVEVNLSGAVAPDAITADADLFERGMTGGISGITDAVDSFVVTTSIRNWPTQFVEGSP